MKKEIKFCDFQSVLDNQAFIEVKGSATEDSDWFTIYQGKLRNMPKEMFKKISKYPVEWFSSECWIPGGGFDEDGDITLHVGIAIKLKNTPASLQFC